MASDTMTRPRWRAAILATGWTVTVALAVAAGGISMDLMIAVMSLWELLGGQWMLPFTPDWPGMALRLAGLGLAVAVAWGTVRYARVSGDACLACGRREETADRSDDRNLARRAAWASVAPAAGYAGLKLYWALGGTAGLTDPDAFSQVSLTTPGFADTVVLAAIGIGLVMVMAYRRPRLPRWIPLSGAVFGIVMLLPTAVLGSLGHLVKLTLGMPLSGMMSTATVSIVYGCFTLWAASLTVTTFAYWRDTRPRCRRCGQR